MQPLCLFLLWEWGGLSSGSTAHVSSKWPTFFPCMCSTVSKSVNLRRQQRFRLFFYRVNFQCYGWMVQKFKNASVPEAWNSASGLFQSPLSHKGMIHRYIWSFNTRKGLNYWTEFATTVLYVLGKSACSAQYMFFLLTQDETGLDGFTLCVKAEVSIQCLLFQALLVWATFHHFSMCVWVYVVKNSKDPF